MGGTARGEAYVVTHPDEQPRAISAWCVIALWLGLAMGCTDAGFKPVAPPALPTVDALLRVEGRFCTEPPEAIVFPVKVLFLLDQSASLQCTDPENRRFQAIDEAVSRLRNNPNVSFGAIGFSSWSRELAFTRDRGALDAALDPAGGLGPATDYQGSLATALRLMESDMLAADPAQRARTRYVVIFVSDGVAEPRCRAGCEDDTNACGNGADDDGDGLPDASDPDCVGVGDAALRPDSLYGVCNTRQQVPDDVYVDFNGLCPAYNQPNQILFRVAELLRVAQSYGVGQVTLHSVLLFAPQEAVEARCPGASASFGYNGGQARALLQAMAREGQGTFRDVNLAVANETSFDFDFSALESDQGLVGFSARNAHATRNPRGELVPDSDRDGLSDERELEFGSDPARGDSDGDHYGDLFEVHFAEAGFDPIDPLLPAAPCSDREDLDSDGLSGCEEDFLGTRVRAPDSDGDGMLDGLELAAGTDPVTADASRDLDFDEIDNGEEVRGATQPLVPDAALYRANRIRYGITDIGTLEVTRNGRSEARSCYDFSASAIPLTTPLYSDARGVNRILLTALERPLLLAGTDARVQVACVEAVYQGPTEKDPVSGLVDLRPEAWARVRKGIADRVAALARCDPESPGVDAYRRDDINRLIDGCLSPRVEIDRTLYQRDELKELVRVSLNSELNLRLPEDVSAFFSPIESFDPAASCYRPKALGELAAILDLLARECAPCPAGSGPDDGDAGESDGAETTP